MSKFFNPHRSHHKSLVRRQIMKNQRPLKAPTVPVLPVKKPKNAVRQAPTTTTTATGYPGRA
jgi:hypothetical protein